MGRDLDLLLMPEERQFENEIVEHLVREDGRAAMETVRMSRTGEPVDVSVLAAPVRLSGTVMGRFHIFRDIRRQKREEARLQHDAMHDVLTGLANRGLFLDRLRLTLARLGRRPERRFAVMFLDLDGFKSVNDSMGHEAGDFLLIEVAKRLRECVRPQDTVARFGGDEFAVLLDEAGTREDTAGIAERIHGAMGAIRARDGAVLEVSASVGIAFVQQPQESAEAIVRDADLAMYQAKAEGKARHVFAVLPGEASARMQPCPASESRKRKTA